MWFGEVAGVPEPLQGTTDDVTVLRLELPLVGGLGGLRGDRGQVFQHPQQLGENKHQ